MARVSVKEKKNMRVTFKIDAAAQEMTAVNEHSGRIFQVVFDDWRQVRQHARRHDGLTRRIAREDQSRELGARAAHSKCILAVVAAQQHLHHAIVGRRVKLHVEVRLLRKGIFYVVHLNTCTALARSGFRRRSLGSTCFALVPNAQ